MNYFELITNRYNYIIYIHMCTCMYMFVWLFSFFLIFFYIQELFAHFLCLIIIYIMSQVIKWRHENIYYQFSPCGEEQHFQWDDITFLGKITAPITNIYLIYSLHHFLKLLLLSLTFQILEELSPSLVQAQGHCAVQHDALTHS